MAQNLPHPDQHHLLAAQGWLELGNFSEAEAELKQLVPELHNHPAVLEVRWQIHARAKRWQDCIDVAAAIIQADATSPLGWIHRSYALHELRRTAEARDGLLGVVGLFPEEQTIAYNLACYECTLGNLPSAKNWLAKVFAGKDAADWRLNARQDADLKALWPEIETL
ncbi:MAG: tetratricopeptide repeat protein [Verrucomicrobiota bacterium]